MSTSRKPVSKFSQCLLAAMLIGVPLASADVSGTWNFNVEIAGVGGGSPTVTMIEDSEGNITGHYAGQLGNTAIEGKAEGQAFQFEVGGDMGTIVYTGELQEDGSLKGTLDLGGMAQGSFTATKQ